MIFRPLIILLLVLGYRFGFPEVYHLMVVAIPAMGWLFSGLMWFVAVWLVICIVLWIAATALGGALVAFWGGEVVSKEGNPA